MGSDQFQPGNKIKCALCDKSDETEVTGPLSSKDSISAHQNCLLFASGIYCKNSPTYDDLFGFDVEDVKKELKRGKRLLCHHCKTYGATAGCDVKRCRHSYHYPCVIEDCGKAVEDITKGRYKVFCKKHDPESKKIISENLLGASLCGLTALKKNGSIVGNRSKMKRRDSDSSTGSSEVSLSKKKRVSFVISDSDDEVECLHPPIDSDIEVCTSPNQDNPSTPDPESKRPCAEPSPSATGSLNSTSAQKACGSVDNPGELHDRSTPVPKNTRPCENLNPSTTEADDDTDIDSDESQSLLPSKQFCLTIPCSVILDCGPSAESEYNKELSSPVSAAPAAVSTSPVSVTSPEHEETPSTNRTSPPPRAPATEPVSPGQAGSPQHSSPTVDGPAVLKSSVKSVSASRFKSGVSSSPGRPTAADVSDEGTMVKSKTSATIFWTRCNEAGWTKEIFSELVSQLSSLGERVQSQKASHQDYDVALKVLGASGQLPCIITQLEQDLEKQEQDLQRKKAALRDAKAVLDV